jgi:hypothetical protein
VEREGEVRCQRSCNPRLRHYRSRAFEISSLTTQCPETGTQGEPLAGCIGPATANDFACKVPLNTRGVGPGAQPSACVFENLTARFAIYRGTASSRRDMTFNWQTVGGFSPLAANIAEETTSVSPRSMVFVPQIGQLAVVDGRLAGLTFISLSSMTVSRVLF